MKKKLNGVITTLTTVAMILTVSGCNSSATSSNGSEKQSGPVTLDVFSTPSNTSGLQNTWWSKIIKNKVGVNLNLLPAGDQGEQKLQAYMASGQLPDIVVFKSRKEVNDAIRAHLLVNLDDHKAQLPNIFNNKDLGTALSYERGEVSNGTGKLFAIPNEVGPADIGDEPNWGGYVRWDLYKKLGMPPVNTLEDYLPLLKKMQQLNPTTPNGQKVYAFSFWKDWDSVGMQQASEFSMLYGIDTGDQLGDTLPFMQVNMTNGDTKSILDPNSFYIQSLKLYYEANQMGLVDPDSLTQRYDTATQKMQQGRVLFTWWGWASQGYNTPDHVNSSTPTGFRPIFPKDSTPALWGDNPIGSTWIIGISAASKHLDQDLKYLNFLYSLDGLQLLTNGPKGVTWDINEKGQPYITKQGWEYIADPNKELPGGGKLTDGINLINFTPFSPSMINPQTNAPLGWEHWPTSMGYDKSKLMADWQQTTGYKTTTAMLQGKNQFTTVPVSFQLVPTIPDDMANIKNQISNVVKNDSWQAVFAKNDAEFNQYINDMRTQADGLGLKNLLEWDKKAWQQAQHTAKKYTK